MIVKLLNCYIVKLLFICLFVYSFIGLFVTPARAESMSSDNYNVELKQTEEPTQKFPVVTSVPIEEKTFTITTSDDFFEFSISDTTANFGILTPTNPITRTTTLSANRSKSVGYSVLAYEDHELILDTTCDDGFCKEDIASVWTNILTYGFGYRCDNLISSDCSDDFSTPDTFKHFANNSKKQPPQVVLKTTSNSERSRSEIIYKINVSNTFKPDHYSNIITYIALPTY